MNRFMKYGRKQVSIHEDLGMVERNGKASSVSLAHLLVMAAIVLPGQSYADGLASDYDSLPPLVSSSSVNDQPNVLLMLDTSGSMDDDTGKLDANGNKVVTYVGANSKDSRTVIARQAIAKLLSNFAENVNMGLMAFEPAPNNYYTRQWTGYGNFWQAENVGWSPDYKINRGYLYIPIGGIDPNDTSASTVRRLDDFNDRLGLDIVTQPAPLDGYYDLFEFDASTYTASSDYTNRRLPSGGGTPLEGTLLSALKYFQGTLETSLYDSSISASDAVWPQNQCKGRDFAILITDGLPTVATSGEAGNDLVSKFVPLVSAQAGRLLDPDNDPTTEDGVITYVIGFSLPSGREYLDQIAAAGGSGQAYFADNLDQLTNTLNLIFTDIINRTSSGTGASVIANRGSGLSAEIQALFTPELVVDGKTVRWAGTLHSMFLDDEGLIREDSNGDGLLGGYNVDRILDFRYDPVAEVTVVDRLLSTSATNPDAIDASQTITSDIEDIDSIWNLRNQLAEVNDVLTQRPYDSAANTGRRIYTSTDGKNLLNFVQISSAGLAALEQQEQDLRDLIDALDKEIYGDITAPADPYLLDGLGSLLSSLSTLIFLTEPVDGVDDGDLIDAVNAVQQEVDSVRSSVDASVATENTNLTGAQSAETAALADLNQAQSDLATQESELANAQSALDQAVADKAAADQAVVDTNDALTAATTARNDAQTALTDSQNAQATAQTDRDNAAAAVATAESDVTAAEGVVTTETADLAAADSTLNTATSDYNAAVSAQSSAQSTFNSAAATAASAQTAEDSALTAMNDAQADLDAAQQTYDDLSALYGNGHPDVQAAAIALADAQQAYDDSVVDYNDAVTASNTADSALATATSDLNTANTDLTNATTTRDSAQAAYDQAASDLAAAESILATEQSDLTSAQGDLADKENALTAANSDVLTKQSDLASAETALTDATNAYNSALTDQTNAATAVVNATTTRDQEQADVTAASAVVGTEQADYDTAVAAREAVEAELARLDKILSDLLAVEDWLSDVLSTAEKLRDMVAQLNLLGSVDQAARDALLALINSLYSELMALISGMPPMTADAEVASLITYMQSLINQIGIVSVVLNDNAPDPLDSIAEAATNLDDKITEKEGYEEALYNTDIQIDQIQYVQYMDDNIPAQTGDPDLTYDQRNSVIAWIRGEEVSGLRNRTIDYDEDGADEVWRLADIVHSTPAVVGRPIGDYYTRYGDTTYREYMLKKFNRRQMIYVGSNDGLLHAVNGGFWDDSQRGYVTQLNGSSAVAHPLGAEIWAYIPKAALPHLQFVADPNYSHMALVDGSPQIFDVNIFPHNPNDPNEIHTGGWGTIMVVTMRMGAGPFTVRVDEDEDGVAEDVVITPSVLVFDVTNPEADPELIAEISHPDLGFTLGHPALIKKRVASAAGGWASPEVNDWYLVFGSGPTDLDTATSTQQASLFAFDLRTGEWADDWSQAPLPVTTESNAFIGDMNAVDWDNDFVDDMVYFGVNTGTVAASDGQVGRLRLRSDQDTGWLSGASVGTFMDVQRTVTGAPLAKTDVYGRHWVYFGTGRLLVSADNNSIQQEYFVGAREPLASGQFSYGSVSTSSLLDISNIEITTDPDAVVNGPAGVTSPSELLMYINENHEGWERELTHNASDPSGRSNYSAVSYRDAIIFSEYIPSDDQCSPDGTSNLWLVNYLTGTAFKEINFGIQTSGATNTVMSSVSTYGMIGPISGVVNGRIPFQTSTSELDNQEVDENWAAMRRQSWRQIFNIEF